MSIEVIVDVHTALSRDAAVTQASALTFVGRHVTVSTASRHSGATVFAYSDADLFMVVSPGFVIDATAVATVEQAFATDDDTDLMFAAPSDGAPARGWCPERLRSHDYLGGVIAIRGDLARRLRGLAGDRYPYHRWDLALRAAEQARGIAISRVPLASREVTAQIPSNPETARRGRLVLHDHLSRMDIRALAEPTPTPGLFRVRRVLAGSPLVTVIVPSLPLNYASTDEQLAALRQVLHSVEQHSNYSPLEVIVVTDDAMPSQAMRDIRELCEATADVLPVCRADSPPSRCLDIAASLAAGEVFVVLDHGTVIDDDEWIQTIVALALDPAVGLACASVDPPGPESDQVAGVQSETTVIPPGCIAIRRSVYHQLPGGDLHEAGPVLPEMLALLGLTCVWTPFVRLNRLSAASRPVPA